MNDRFKFRVWNKAAEKFVERFILSPDDGICIISDKGKTYVKGNPNYILMQCTGLKDKNGKLIYEGDIVFNNCGRWIIKYCDVCKSFQCFDNTYGCYACEGDYQWCDFIEDLNKTTIEGNIYENKELLNEYL